MREKNAIAHTLPQRRTCPFEMLLSCNEARCKDGVGVISVVLGEGGVRVSKTEP